MSHGEQGKRGSKGVVGLRSWWSKKQRKYRGGKGDAEIKNQASGAQYRKTPKHKRRRTAKKKSGKPRKVKKKKAW